MSQTQTIPTEATFSSCRTNQPWQGKRTLARDCSSHICGLSLCLLARVSRQQSLDFIPTGRCVGEVRTLESQRKPSRDQDCPFPVTLSALEEGSRVMGGDYPCPSVMRSYVPTCVQSSKETTALSLSQPGKQQWRPGAGLSFL